MQQPIGQFRKLILVLLTLLIAFPAVSQERLDSVLIQRNWVKTGVQFGTSLAVNLTVTTLLKNAVSCTRPDGSNDQSFPSRHAAIAFSWGFRASQILYKNSPWWVLGSQAVATGVGFERIIDRKHFPSDVLAGAVIGIGSACIGDWVSNLVFPSSKETLPDATNEFMPALDMITTALFPVTRLAKGHNGRTGFGASLRGRLPMGDNFGACVSMALRSIPVYQSGNFINPLNTLGLNVGVIGYSPLSQRFAFEYSATTGAAKLFHTDGWKHAKMSYTIDADCGATMQLTSSLAVGMNAGYSMMTMPKAVSMLSVSLLSRATF